MVTYHVQQLKVEYTFAFLHRDVCTFRETTSISLVQSGTSSTNFAALSPAKTPEIDGMSHT